MSQPAHIRKKIYARQAAQMERDREAAAEERRAIEAEEEVRIAATPRMGLRRQALIADEEVKVSLSNLHTQWDSLHEPIKAVGRPR